MTARRPWPIEGLAARLVPPAAAEHVLGDLAECSPTAGRYAAGARFLDAELCKVRALTAGAQARDALRRQQEKARMPMFSRHLAIIFVVVLMAVQPAAAQTPAPRPIPPDAEIRAMLVARVDTHRQTPGIVLGVIEPAGRRVLVYGRRAADDTRPLDEHTVFEIGSITKVFTSLLLADAVQRGEVALTDPVATYLPSDVTVPERGDRQITLQDLATHTSGLPRCDGRAHVASGRDRDTAVRHRAASGTGSHSPC